MAASCLRKQHGPVNGRQIEHVTVAEPQAPQGLRSAAGDFILLALLLVQRKSEAAQVEGRIDLLVQLACRLRWTGLDPLRAFGGLDAQQLKNIG